MWIIDDDDDDMKPIPEPQVDGQYGCYGHTFYRGSIVEGNNYWDCHLVGNWCEVPTNLDDLLTQFDNTEQIKVWWEKYNFNYIRCQFGAAHGALPVALFGWVNYNYNCNNDDSNDEDDNGINEDEYIQDFKDREEPKYLKWRAASGGHGFYVCPDGKLIYNGLKDCESHGRRASCLLKDIYGEVIYEYQMKIGGGGSILYYTLFLPKEKFVINIEGDVRYYWQYSDDQRQSFAESQGLTYLYVKKVDVYKRNDEELKKFLMGKINKHEQ